MFAHMNLPVFAPSLSMWTSGQSELDPSFLLFYHSTFHQLRFFTRLFPRTKLKITHEQKDMLL